MRWLASLARASAQENISYALTWTEVLANSNTVVPVPNGVLDSGEGARISLRVTITPGIGSPANFTPPPPPGTGVIAGLGSIVFDLNATNTLGGTWSNLVRAPGWVLGGPGTGGPGGSLSSAQAGQFVLPGGVANGTNPIINIWTGVWTPSVYTARNVSFQSVGALKGGGNHSSILIRYGTDAQGNPQYVAKFVGGTFGNTGPISIVPCLGDLDGNASVNVTDLLALIGPWGPHPGPPFHAADLNASGSVNVTDLLALINEWGPCW